MKSLFFTLMIFISFSLSALDENEIQSILNERIEYTAQEWDEAVKDDNTCRMYYYIGMWEAFTEISDLISQSSTPD